MPRAGAHYTKALWGHNPKFMMIFKNYNQIRSQFCICHNSAVMTCAKLWHDWIIRIGIMTKIIFTRFQLRAHKMIMIPLCVCWGWGWGWGWGGEWGWVGLGWVEEKNILAVFRSKMGFGWISCILQQVIYFTVSASRWNYYKLCTRFCFAMFCCGYIIVFSGYMSFM